MVLAAGFAALGVWQVERRAWKLELIAKVEARVRAVPTPLPGRAAWNGDNAYRRVRVSGRWLHDRETLVQAVTERGAGFWVMTPLVITGGERPDQTIVLINRGFVPAKQEAQTLSDGLATITGLMRESEPGGGFLRRNDPVVDRWYSRDVAAIARARRLTGVAPFFVDADAAPNPGGYPVGGLTVIAFRNNHLMYSLTWFGLAVLSLSGAVIVLRRRAPSGGRT
ncbi:SURF1 family protein [Sphingomonas radiodurans]|nr:SURF1 family protein [Sphingomonas radiodurans]WBH18220.1 SURF1 family protein [Sphingomonas radiodurans]